MKREIKFRGKRVDNNEWIEGYYVQLAGFDYIVPFNSAFRDILDADFEAAFEEVDAKTLSQWIGFSDKNGVEIYEGDIVRYYQPYSKTFHTHIVRWDDLLACFGLFEQDSKWYVESDWLRIEEIEVVGNIHDKHKQKQALIDMMRGDEEIGLYDDNPKNQ